MVVKLGQGVVFRPGSMHDERWGPGQFLSGMVVSINENDASLVLFPDTYPPYYEVRVKRDDSLSQDRTWTPAVGESQTMPEAPTDGQIYGRRNQAWTPISGEDQGYIQAIVVADVPPPNALVGMAWFDTTINNFFIFEQGKWLEPAHLNPQANLVPIVSPIVTGTVALGEELSCTTGTWSGTPASYTFQWFRSGVPITGESTSTYMLQPPDVDNDIYCVVTVTDSIGLVQSAPSNIMSIRSPSNTIAPQIGGTFSPGGTLVCSDGTWAGPPPMGFGYQWKRDGVEIVGETSNAYIILAGDLDTEISCTVVATNLIGSGSVDSPSVLIGIPVNVVAPSLVVVSGLGGLFSTFRCEVGTWSSATSYAYQWKRDTLDIAGETTYQYFADADDSGRTIHCTVTAGNGFGSTAADSNSKMFPVYANFNPTTALAATVSDHLLPNTRVTHDSPTIAGGARSGTKVVGKWVIEAEMNVIRGGNSGFCLARDAASFSDMAVGIGCLKVRKSDGQIWINGIYMQRTVGAIADGDTICIAVDFDGLLVWFRRNNGLWNGDSSASPGVSGGLGFSLGAYAPSVVFGGPNTSTEEFATCFFGATGTSASVPGFIHGWTP